MGRLIDADRLKVMFEIEECPCALQAAILGIIDAQPTAYDPGRIVEQMKNNEEKLISVIKTLCDAIVDAPCGCDTCPYGEYEEQCEAHNLIEDIEDGEVDAEH